MSLPADTENTKPTSPPSSGDPVEATASSPKDSSSQDSASANPPAPMKLLGVTLPQSISQPLYAASNRWQTLRTKTIQTLPEIAVNNSSNVVGITQMCGEALMFKQNGTDLIPKGKPRNLWTYIVEPPKSIFNSVFLRARMDKPLKEIFSWSSIKDAALHFNDLERATRIDSMGGTKPLVNRLSARSSFSGMLAMFVAATLPNENDTPEATLKNATFAKRNPIGYVAARIGQGFFFPVEATYRFVKKLTHPSEDQHIGEHKRQFAGIGMVSAGVFSVLSGFRQIENKFGEAPQHYMRNKWQMLGGAITTVAGSFLTLAIDNQQGWTTYGNTQFFRLAPLVPSITKRFTRGPNGGKEQGAEWYLAAQGTLQFKNVVASLIGGAEKHDGVIIDHKLMRKDAQKKAREDLAKEKGKNHPAPHADTAKNASEASPEASPETSPEAPSPRIQSPLGVEKAMPERVAKVAEAQGAAANDAQATLSANGR